MRRHLPLTAFLLPTILLATPALAHQAAPAMGSGFRAGLEHPVLGLDHLLAMFAVGVWGAQMGGRRVWELPVAFPMVMAAGGALGIAGVPLPAVEPAIALSMAVLGLAILAAWKAPEWAALVIVGAFAVFHGYAHGTELPALADPVYYALGFVVATGVIHIAGIGFGMALRAPLGGWIARFSGGAIAIAGLWFIAA